MSSDNDKRKSDLKNRIAVLSTELTPALAKVENLRSRIVELEDTLRDVLDAIREDLKGNQK